MWVILAATVGLAAIVDVEVNRLGEPQTLGKVSLRLPRNWQPTEEDGAAQIELRERGPEDLARTVTVRYESPSFSLDALFGSRRKEVKNETIPLPDGSVARLRVLRRALETPFGFRGVYELETIATVPDPSGKTLLISIQQISLGERSDIEANVRLIKRILDTVTFD